MSRKYLASLALAAFIVLTLGVFARDLLRTEATAPAPPSEASALQQLSQEGQLRRLSDFLSERVAAVAPLVTFVSETGAAGVRWGHGDTIVTTLPNRPVVVVRAPATDTIRRSSLVGPDSARREWVLVVGRTPTGAVVSAAGILGGTTVRRCADRQLTEYIVSAALHDGFAGAGLFDLTGRTLGVIVRCDGRPIAISTREVSRITADTGSVASRVWDVYGLAVTPLDDQSRAYFATDSGVVVTAVHRDMPAEAAALRPGDVLVRLDERPLTSFADLAPLGDSASGGHTVRLRRGTSVANIQLSRVDAAGWADSLDAGIEVAESSLPAGLLIDAVRPGSPAEVAGLRSGDRLLRVGERDVGRASDVRRVLNAARRRATFVVFERDSVVRGVLLRPR